MNLEVRCEDVKELIAEQIEKLTTEDATLLLEELQELF